MLKWNLRYVLYAAANGKTAEEMLQYDKERLPGACMMEFSFWIQEQWRTWRKLTLLSWDAPLSNVDHACFDSWLFASVHHEDYAQEVDHE